MEELTKAIEAMSFEDYQCFIDWLKECAKDARHDEPSVGIFANDRLANGFEAVIALVEGMKG